MKSRKSLVTLVAFCVHYTRGAWPYIIVDAVLVTAIAIADRMTGIRKCHRRGRLMPRVSVPYTKGGCSGALLP